MATNNVRVDFVIIPLLFEATASCSRLILSYIHVSVPSVFVVIIFGLPSVSMTLADDDPFWIFDWTIPRVILYTSTCLFGMVASGICVAFWQAPKKRQITVRLLRAFINPTCFCLIFSLVVLDIFIRNW